MIDHETLPSTWEITDLSNITLPVSTVDPKQCPKERFTYLDISGIDNNTNTIEETKTYLGVAAPSRARQLVQKGDILFSTVRTYLKNIARVPPKLDGAVASTGFCVLRPAKGVCSDFIFYYTLTPSFLNPLADLQRGSSYPAVRDTDVRSQHVPLPPSCEQLRIVAKIEELCSELDKGIESLNTAREQLKIYRQTLLKHAFEGKLTAVWRERNKEKLESSEELVKRIKAQREAHYQQQVTDWQKAVNSLDREDMTAEKPLKPAQPKVLPPVSVEELADLPQLPDGWAYLTAEEVCDFITKGTTPEKPLLSEGSGDVPFIKVYNLTTTGILDFSINPTYVSEATHNRFLSRSKCYPGDVLMNIVGPPLGKVSIVPPLHKEWNINQAIARFRSVFLRCRYLCHFLLWETTVRRLISKSKATAGQFNLTLELCRKIVIPVPPTEEQAEIEQKLCEQLSSVEELGRAIDAELLRSEALRQSILTKAFTGRLVPQDPNDEPASMLLARIKSERVNSGSRTRTTSRKTTRKKVPK